MSGIGLPTLLLLFLQLQGALPTEFDEPVEYTETYTYEDTNFMFFSKRVTWDEANILCPNYRSRLAIVDNWATAQFLAESMAYSNMIFDDIWIGGRQVRGTWRWVSGKQIPTEINNEGYPPWVRTRFRSGKDCLVMDRRLHDEPVFADTDCRLMRPFICERSTGLEAGYPVPVKWEQIGNSVFVFYHGRLSWEKAASFCREHGKRLAVVTAAMDTPAVLGSAMTLSRPDFESVWIGGYSTYGSWIWLATGEEIPPQMDPITMYPPWKNENTSLAEGCLLFDRHECDQPKFVSLLCERRRDFVCEEFVLPDSSRSGNISSSFVVDNVSYTLFVKQLSWHEAYRSCDELGGELVILKDKATTDAIIDIMADHSEEIHHVWVGGTTEDGKWIWSPTYQPIPPKVDGFPPWCYDSETLDATFSQCLNLDRKDHITPLIYGLSCNNTQPYVCRNEKSKDYKYDRENKITTTTLKPYSTISRRNRKRKRPTTSRPITIATTQTTITPITTIQETTTQATLETTLPQTTTTLLTKILTITYKTTSAPTVEKGKLEGNNTMGKNVSINNMQNTFRIEPLIGKDGSKRFVITQNGQNEEQNKPQGNLTWRDRRRLLDGLKG